MSLRWDEAGAIQVVEAILVAVLVAGALIFFALAQRPSLPPAEQPTDLSGAAQDALNVLQGASPGGCSDALTLFLVGVPSTCPGTTTVPDNNTMRNSTTNLLPLGLQFSLRTDNGTGAVERLNSSISGSVAFPGRGAQAGMAYVLNTTSGVQRLVRVDLVVWDVF